jgi:two-component system sensor histidine kinase RegB
MAVDVVGATNDRADSWPVRAYLREMLVLRAAEAAGAIALVAYQIVATHEHFSVPILVTAVLLFYISTWIIFLHLQSGRPLSDIQMTCHLMVDLAVLGLLLFTASGTTNPFAILYLPLVVVAAATLRDALLGTVVVACIASYGVLMTFHHEWWVDEMDPHHRGVELGTWMALSMVVCFIAVFVNRLSHIAREQQKREQIASEKSHRDEALISLASLAAGTAHELNTPLSTMAVIVDEMRYAENQTPLYKEQVAMLAGQIDACRVALKDMVVAASADHFEGAREVRVLEFLDEVLDRFRFLRPGVQLAFTYERLDDSDTVVADKTLAHSLINLINNAADASPQEVEVMASSEGGLLTVAIRDRGAGIPRSIREQIGRPFFTTKGAANGKGNGVGLFITNRTIESFGGEVMMFERAGGGTCVLLTLPLKYRNETGGVHGRNLSSGSPAPHPAGG